MKHITTHTGTLRVIGRLPSSANGNPRYQAVIMQGEDLITFVTAPDSKYGYSITNYEGQLVTVELGMSRGKVTLKSIKQV
jgi:hypothetical protein